MFIGTSPAESRVTPRQNANGRGAVSAWLGAKNHAQAKCWLRTATFFMLLPANPYYPSAKKRLADDFAFEYTKPVRRRFAAIGETGFRPALVWPLAPFPGPMTNVTGTID